MKKNFMKENHGITLIAMIITIIVMLVLAGVSMNAIVGDNGILSNAINATTATSIAVLHEYLQELYVENYDSLNLSDSKVDALSNMTEYMYYFYSPSRDDGIGTVNYIVDSEGHALYLINKNGLPKDIQNQLVGGNAGNKEYSDYASLTDVYGVTANLEVYYCSNGLSSISGLAVTDLDYDDPNRKVTISNGLATILGTDTTVTASSLRLIESVTINSSSNLNSLSELYNLTSLKELYLDNVEISLSGLENSSQLTYICFENYRTDKISNYSIMSKLKKLQYLYIICSCDTQISNILSAMSNTDYTNLTYIGICNGYDYVSDTSGLASLTSATKSAVSYLYLYSNYYVTSISCLSGFTNIYRLELTGCKKLESLSGIENMTKLTYFIAYNCYNLGRITNTAEDGSVTYSVEDASTGTVLSVLENKEKLYYVHLQNDSYIANVSYLKNDTSIRYLYLAGCSSTMSVNGIGDIIRACGNNYNLPVKFLQGSKYSVSDYYTASDALYNEIWSDLYENTYITILSLSSTTLTNSQYNEILASMPNLKYVQLYNCSNLTTIEFVESLSYLIELDLRGTSVTTEGYENDLTLINNISTLTCLAIDNSEIDLTKIQNKIASLTGGGIWNNVSYGGLFIGDDNITSLCKCTSLTYLRLGIKYLTVSTLDLSSLENLTNFGCGQSKAIQITIPDSVTTCYIWCIWILPKFTTNSNINYFYYQTDYAEGYAGTSLADLCKTFSSCTNLRTIDIGFNKEFSSEYSDLCNLNSSTLTSFTRTNHGDQEIVKDLKCLSGCTNLTTICITGWDVQSLDGIEQLTSLQKLTIIDSPLSGLAPLQYLENLQYLDLRNDCLYDTSSYLDSEGNTVTYKNLKIISDLKSNHNLTTVYLSGNNSITDWSLLSNFSGWNSTSYSGW